MSPVKISAINTHVPTISRISASTINVNNYIEKRSRRSISRNGSDGTDDDEQIIAVPGWDDDSEEENTQSVPQSDNEDENSQREPTQYDSDSETEESQPQPKRKQVRSIKGESSTNSSKTAKNTEKSTKKPSNKKESKDSEEKPKNSRSKQAKKDEKSAPAKGKSKKPVVEEEHISETSKSITFESDNEDATVSPVVEKPPEAPKNRSKSPGKQQKLETTDTTPKRQPQLPNLVGKKSNKKRSNRRELTDPIDNKVFTTYREAIAPFFETIKKDGKEISPEDRFKEIDAFYTSVEKLASRMEEKYNDTYSKHNLQIKKNDKKQSELQYVDGESIIKAKSPINGQDILKFFRMNPMKKELEMDDVEAFLMGPFIDTVNVLSIDTKQLSLLDYDRLTLFSHFNDIGYQKPSVLEYNMPSYIKLISKLNKWSFSGVFEARTNWLCMIPDTDKEQMWNAAVRSFDAFKAEDNNVSETVLNIWDNLIHSQYIKQFIMYCANPSPLFGKIFKLFLETDEYKEDMIVLFEGPLEPIASMFTPIHFSYRGVEYGNSEDAATFSDLVKVSNDPAMYDPRINAWIARLT